MEFIADLHIHSKYSRATAKNLDFENLYYTAQIKGVTLIGTGDFTYPAWIDEIESKLEEAEPGLFSLKKEFAEEIDKNIPKNCRHPVRFILQTEISNIYKKDGRVRKNHNLVYFPDIVSVKRFNARLDAIGNIKSDGRPILGLDAADLLKIMLDVNDQGYLGRNASVFNTDLSFFNVRQALETNDLEKYKGTLDMFPHQGKYHYDGHRKCNICLNPATTRQIDGICPECGRQVTYGVLNRVQELATREEGYVPENRHGFKSIVPLNDILAEIFEVGPKTKKVAGYYKRAIEALGPELGILLDKTLEEIDTAWVPLLSDAILKMRTGDIKIDPGYDGEYGKVNLFSRQEKERLKGEKNLLFDLPSKRAKSRVKKVVPRQDLNKKIPKKNKKLLQPVKPKGLLQGLNPEQKKAVESTARAMVIQSGPGTGKTRTLTAKIAYLVSKKGIDPGHILALTFTNKAARQLEQRIDKHVPKTKKSVLAATFHSFCLKLLKEYKGFDAAIVDDDLKPRFTLFSKT